MAKGRRDSTNVASVADYDTEAEEEVQESRKLANSGAKRSSGIADPPVLHTDLASDSGYSSKTQATSASTGSALSVEDRVGASLVIAQGAAGTGALARRRVAGADTGSQRSGSSTSTKTKKKIVVKCKDPNCAECIKAREKAVRQQKTRSTAGTEASPERTSRDRSADKASSTATVRPKATIIQPAQPRRRDSQQAASRPTSMYEMQGALVRPNGGYLSHQGHPVGYQHPAGPIAFAERSNTAMMSARGGGVPSARYAPVAYDPQAGQRVSARRVMQPTVVQTDLDEEKRRRLAPVRAAQARQAQALEDSEEEDDDESESESDEEDYSDDEEEADAAEYMRRMKGAPSQNLGNAATMAQMQQKLAAAKARQQELEIQRQRIQIEQAKRAAMPPPPVPPPPPATALPLPPSTSAFSGQTTTGQALPSMRRAQQAQISYLDRRPSQMDEYSEDLRASIRALNPGPIGTSMPVRPSLTSNKATSYSHPEFDHSIGDPSRTNRRLSYIGDEHRDVLEHRHADFERLQLQRLITDAVAAKLADLDLLPSQKAKVGFAMDDKLKHAMAYQTHTDRTAPRRPSFGDSLGELPSIPLTAGALRRRDGLPSHTSSGTKRSAEEEASRISVGHRLTAGSESVLDGGEMRLRLDTSRFMEIDIDGRTVVLNPLEGNNAELIISGRRETTYLSTKGSSAAKSVLGRAPSQRERRGTASERDRRTEYDHESERTERRTVYRDQDRRREHREERREHDELRYDRKPSRRDDRRRHEERRDERRDNERRRDGSGKKRRDDEYTSESESELSSEDDRRTQRTVRRGRGNSYESDYIRSGKPKSSKKSYREDDIASYDRSNGSRRHANSTGSVVFGG